MENFIVSARKYRPATFASVVGQKHITSTLKNAIERGQLAHAYLFCGPRGVGKTTCARIFAKAINCLHPEGAEACNDCESCRSFNENRSLNIHELDAASNNSVDDIRNLIEQVRILPQGGRYSVFIIDEVHMLSAAAFNAFLKTLEEPPAHAVFILATTEKHKILPTILSRCQIYDFNRIKVEDSVEYLKYIAGQEGVGYDEESLNLIAQKADGGMRDALSMFDKAVSFCGARLEYKSVAQTLNVLDYDTYFNVTDMLLGGDYLSALRLFDEVLAKGFSGQTFMAGLAQHMRDLLVARDAASVSLIELTGTLLERYRAQAGRCTIEFLFGAISLLTEADGRIRQSSNQRLLVELGLMKIAGLGQKKNDGVALGTSYPLPPLTGQNAPAANPRHTTSGPSAAPTSATIAATATGTPSTATPAPAAGNAGVRRGCHHARGGSRPAGNGRRRTGRRTARNSTHAGKGPGSAGVPTCRGDKRRIAHRRRIAVVAAEPGTAGSRTGDGAGGCRATAACRHDRPGERTEAGKRPHGDPRLHPAGTSPSLRLLRAAAHRRTHAAAGRTDRGAARGDPAQQAGDAHPHRRDRRRGGGARIGGDDQRADQGRAPHQTRRPAPPHEREESAAGRTAQGARSGSGITENTKK